MSNTQTLSRRNVLIGASIAAVAAGAPALATAHIDPDLHTLLVLERELIEANEHYDATVRNLELAREEADLATGPEPMHPKTWERHHKPKMPEDLKKMEGAAIASIPVGEVRHYLADGAYKMPEPVHAWHARVKAERERVETEWDEYSARRDKQRRIAGYDEDLFGAAYQDCVDIAHCLFEVPANSLEGMAVKVRAAELLGWFDGVEPDEEFYDSIVDDIKRLAAAETGDPRS